MADVMAAQSVRASVLREAEQLVDGARDQTYGTPTENFGIIAELISTRFRHKLRDGVVFTAADYAQIQILVKVARNIVSDKRDNWVDIAGYAACGAETAAASVPYPPSSPEVRADITPDEAIAGDIDTVVRRVQADINSSYRWGNG